ncbi:MAG: hypothetical protein LBR81_08285 [Prevotellaceae bacterium]|jgi:hypothetical protein|nr:hypothetical protein [Prevotellaceae bacterium]
MRKINFPTVRFLTFLLLLCGLTLSSCIDDKLDLDNLSDDMQWNGSFAGPVLAKSKVTVAEMVGAYDDPENAARFRIIDNILTMQFDYEVPYEMPDINTNFGNFNTLIDDLVVLPDGTPIGMLSGGTTLSFPVNCNLWQSVNENESPARHRIKRIEFLNTDVILDVQAPGLSFNGGSVTLEVELPQTGANPTKISFVLTESGQKTLTSNFTIDLEALHAAGDKLKINIAASGTVSGTSSLTVSLKLDTGSDNSEFIAFGYFNYDDLLGGIKEEGYKSDIAGEFKNAKQRLSFPEARFEFDIASSFGVPIIFEIEEITAFHKDVNGNDSTGQITEQKDYEIKRVNNVGETAVSPININNDEIPGISGLITTSLDSISLKYSVGTVSITHDGNWSNPTYACVDCELNGKPVTEQFISSKNTLGINTHTTIPCVLGEGDYIYYRDTIALDISESDSLDLDQFNVEEANLIFICDNGLPFASEVNVWLATGSEGHYTATTVAPYETHRLEDFTISFNKERVNDLKKAKALILEYRMPPLPGGDPDKRTLKGDDYLQLQVGLQLKKISYTSN